MLSSNLLNNFLAEKPEDRATCEVDGKIYKDGEYFVPASETDKSCYCGPNYNGMKNIKINIWYKVIFQEIYYLRLQSVIVETIFRRRTRGIIVIVEIDCIQDKQRFHLKHRNKKNLIIFFFRQ